MTLEPGILPPESQANRTNGTIALLTDDDFSNALFGTLGIVNFIAVNETNQIRILFYGTRIMTHNPISQP